MHLKRPVERRIWVGAAVTLAAVASCAQPMSSRIAASSSSVVSSVSPSPAPTTAADRATLAQHVADQLLGSVQLPPSAQIQSSAPPILAQWESGPVNAQNLLTSTTWFVAPGTLDSVLAYEQSHRPAGLGPSTDVGHGSGPGSVEADESFFGVPTAAYGAPALWITAATEGGGSVGVEAQVTVVWRPVRTAAEHVPDTVTGATAVYTPETDGSAGPSTTIRLDEPTARKVAALLNSLDTNVVFGESCGMAADTTITFVVHGRPLVFDAGWCGDATVTYGGAAQPTLSEYDANGSSALVTELDGLFGVGESSPPS
jgi:hypothetical protein